MEFKKIDSIVTHSVTISAYFREFYAREPWGDFFTCPLCAEGSDPALWPRFNQPGKCSNCGNNLDVFWNEGRTKRFLIHVAGKKSFLAFGAFQKNVLVGWIWGYEKADKIFYIDFVGLDKRMRRVGFLQKYLVPALFILKMAISPTKRMWPIDELLDIFKPIFGLLYRELLHAVGTADYRQIWGRTHVLAKNIHRILKIAGFKMVERSGDRMFFARRI